MDIPCLDAVYAGPAPLRSPAIEETLMIVPLPSLGPRSLGSLIRFQVLYAPLAEVQLKREIDTHSWTSICLISSL